MAIVDKWLEDDNLLLLESWTRDGYTELDICRRIGINKDTLTKWKKTYPEILDALSKGKEITDYKVENALLKSALGYKTKETKITTIMRFGKVVETQTETTEKEQIPNVSAIQMWLYNRQKDKWKNMNAAKNIFEDMEEDTSIEITIKRADKNESGFEQDTSEYEIDEKDIILRKRTEEEQAAYKKENKNKEKTDRDTEEYIKAYESYDENIDEWEEDEETEE